ncbi:hypothetical protein MN116_002912 [Schistosoma mekongi]|uniref:C-type lectin domain-containing protein n=1 Tax=Schistosoma mekongi TaxID=38744 RepID=A0AAE1ZH83_SCHME|nr:hypothetical protein MN116_002912 [Schistosoma mekongi]
MIIRLSLLTWLTLLICFISYITCMPTNGTNSTVGTVGNIDNTNHTTTTVITTTTLTTEATTTPTLITTTFEPITTQNVNVTLSEETTRTNYSSQQSRNSSLGVQENITTISTTLSPFTNNNANETTSEYSTTTSSPLTTEASINSLNNMTNSSINLTNSTSLPSQHSTNASRPHTIKGRVILATTREKGSRVWGLTADKAEEACRRFVKNSVVTSALSNVNKTNNTSSKSSELYEGHLLSVISNDEIIHLVHLMGDVPVGSYWTGGRIMRPKHIRTHGENNTNWRIILTWSDGRTTPADILGMTNGDENNLIQGMTYCLSLDISRLTWQARDCKHRLPYACLITTRNIPIQTTTTNSPKGLNVTQISTNQSHMINSTVQETKLPNLGKMLNTSIIANQSESNQTISTLSSTTESTLTTPTAVTLSLKNTENITIETNTTPSQIQNTSQMNNITLSSSTPTITGSNGNSQSATTVSSTTVLQTTESTIEYNHTFNETTIPQVPAAASWFDDDFDDGYSFYKNSRDYFENDDNYDIDVKDLESMLYGHSYKHNRTSLATTVSSPTTSVTTTKTTQGMLTNSTETTTTVTPQSTTVSKQNVTHSSLQSNASASTPQVK